jgi:hypothetical protein
LALSAPTPDFEYSPIHFFEEVCFPLEADHFHPFKLIASFVVSLAANQEQPVTSSWLAQNLM